MEVIVRRSVPKWVGKTCDTPVPSRVKLRVFDSYNGKCYLSGQKINPGDKWEVDHIVAIINGGKNSEDNLAPALSVHHKQKTRQDVATKSKTAKIKKRHIGITKTKGRPMPGTKASGLRKRMDGTVERR